MTVRRLAFASIAVAGALATTWSGAVAQQPGQLSYEETRRCVQEGSRLDKELPAIQAQRPAVERDGAEVERLGAQVEELRGRSTAVFDPAVSRQYEELRDRHYREYERYTREMTAYNQRVAAYNTALADYNRDCAPDKLYGLYLERAERELGLR